MSRVSRFVLTDVPYHITQRGNFQQVVFLEDEDWRFYLDRLSQYSCKWKLDILAYCLMNNHVHLVVIPREKSSLAKSLGTLNMCYSQYFNKKHDRQGHLWQARFYSAIMDDGHLYATVRYVEQNPTRAGLVQYPWDWAWSSARTHLGVARSPVALFDVNSVMKVTDWKKYLAGCEEDDVLDNIRQCTYKGKVLGSVEFVHKLEKMTGCLLQSRPSGRPKKTRDSSQKSTVPSFYADEV